MSTTEMPTALTPQATPAWDGAQAARAPWIETVLAVSFTVAAVLFGSFLAVVTGLV
jgi:hypothetical protein